MIRVALASLLLTSSPVWAREARVSDARISENRLTKAGSARILTSTETTQLVMLPLGQTVVSISLSDPAAYFANVVGDSDMLYLRATRSNAAAILTVRTQQHEYDLELIPGTDRPVATVVRLYVSSAQQMPRKAEMISPVSQPQYRLSGSKSLRPTFISDDGEKTYIEWAGDFAMPATFAIGPTGKEQMVDGYMRGSKFTIDRIYDHFVFRIDREMARATRTSSKSNDE